ncbi:MAG: tetratricopeptide repeat protein [Terriglobia bacterium]
MNPFSFRTMIVSLVLCLQAALCFASLASAQTPARNAKSKSTGTSEGRRSSVKSASEEHFDKAQKLLSEGNFQGAVQEYRLSLEDTPENEAAHFGIGLALTRLGKPDEAIQSYEAALHINPKLWEAELNWGIILINRKDFDGAIPHFRNVQKLEAGNFHANFLEGKAQEGAGRPTLAIPPFLRALSLAKEEQDKVEVHTALGAIYFRQQEWKPAEEHLSAAKAGGRKDPQLDMSLADIYFQTDQLDQCEAILKPLAEEKNQDAHVQEMMAHLLSKKKDYGAAAQYFERAISLQSDKTRKHELIMDLISAYEKAGQPAKSMTLLKGEAFSTKDPDLLFHLGTLCLHQRDDECAIQSFLMTLKLKPDCIECYSNLGAVFVLVGKFPEAIVTFSKFKESRPEFSGTYFYLGLAYDKLGDVPNAMANYQKFLELDQGKNDVQNFQATERLKVLRKTRKKH